eukprot:TRINITY_DN12829_c0_g1_i1.p1 TRINITY_DN12829_c0_g1~~TRINITY_DN12829_c0_g1_i1.p1  ORF type:complete len:328 (-),score=35.18 TRINITY_DN12829_c0_g1_i1:134-976(-)
MAIDEIRCAILVMDEMTNVQSADATNNLLQAYDPKIVINAGCGGTIHSDLHLLDVIVADVIDLSFSGAAVSKTIELSGDAMKATDHLRRDFHMMSSIARDNWKDLALRTSQELQRQLGSKKLEDWQVKYNTRVGDKKMLEKGRIASSDYVSKNLEFGKFLQEHRDRKLVCVEMEGGGVGVVLRSKRPATGFMVLRGISDAADNTKNEMDAQDKLVLRHCAIYNVMASLLCFLKTPQMKKQLTPKETPEAEGFPQDTAVKEHYIVTNKSIGKVTSGNVNIS